MRKYTFLPIAFALVAMAYAQLAHAESLAGRVPADAVGYAEWSGSETLGKSYDNSHLKQFLDVLNLPQFLSQKVQEKTQKDAGDPQKLADAKLGQDLIAAITKAPTAFYFGPMDFANANEPNPHIALFSRLGPVTAAEFAQRLTEVIDRHKNDGPHFRRLAAASAAGDYLLITIGSDMSDFSKRLTGPILPENLAAIPAYKEALTHVNALTTPPAALVYVDGEAVLKLIDEAVAVKGPPPARDGWPKAREAFHFDAIHQIAWAGNFDAGGGGGNWIDQCFVGLSAERAGIAAFLDHKPLSGETLKLIPKSVTFAGVARFDAARFLDDLRDAATKMEPQRGGEMFDMMLRQFFAFTGVELKKDIVDNLGDEFAIYTSQDAAGTSFRGFTVATRVKDGPKIETALSNLESTINAMTVQRNPEPGFKLKIEPLPAPNDEITAHIYTIDKTKGHVLPMIDEWAWAVAGDAAYLSASSAALQSAVDNQAAGKRGSITDNPDFAVLFKKLGQDKIASFAYIDLAKITAEIYPHVSAGIAKHHADHPEEKNPFILPPLDKITPTLSPALMITWTDKDGFHVRSIGPFPLANVMVPGALMRGAASKKTEAKIIPDDADHDAKP